MATLGKNLLGKNLHQKSDSEALDDLSSAFHDLDIDGEGLLDQASFLTALSILGVTDVSPVELEKIFEVLDEEKNGMIKYEKLKEFMKIGKIPSTILNKVKSTGNNNMFKKRKSIMFGSNTGIKSNNNKNKNNLSILPLLREQETEESDMKEKDIKMDVNRLKMLQRAVLVIKKAAMKTISRNEVIEFLKAKGMNINDIELAYNKAQQQVMSPEERIKYLNDLSQTRLNELNQQKQLNNYLSSQISTQSQEIEILRHINKICADKLIEIFPNKIDKIISKLPAEELTKKIQQITKDLKNAEKQNDSQAVILYTSNLKVLQLISQCVTNKQHFHAFLYFHQLENVIRDSLPYLQEFLSDYSDFESK